MALHPLPRLPRERELGPFPAEGIGRFELPAEGLMIAMLRRPGDGALVIRQRLIEVPEEGDPPIPEGDTCVIEDGLIVIHPGPDELERGWAAFRNAVELALEVQ